MNKRITIVLIVFMLFGIGSFIQAQGFSLSAGGGLALGNNFYSGKPVRYYNDNGVRLVGDKINEMGIGAFAFFDATYAELNGGYKLEMLRGTTDSGRGIEGSRRSLNFGGLGKFPFYVGSSIKINPLLGVQYTIVNYYERDGTVYNDLSIRDGLWIIAGGGGDFFLSGSLFLRVQLLYGYMLKTQQQKNRERDYSYLTHGPSVNLALGYQFFKGDINE